MWPHAVAAVNVLLGWALATSAQPSTERPPDELHERPLITEVQFVGNDRVPDETLAEAVLTKATECRSWLFWPICRFSNAPTFAARRYLDPEELTRDVLRLELLYWRVGYRSASVDTAIVPTGSEEVRVVFRVEEGPPTVITELDVVRPGFALSPDRVRTALRIETGRPLNLFAIDSSVTRLRHALWEEGYAAAQVDPQVTVADSANTAIVFFLVDPRWLVTVDSISILGNQRIADQTIRNMLLVEEGDVYRRSDLVESQRNLYTSNLFRRVAFTVPGDTLAVLPDSTVHIIIAVDEAPLNSVGLTGAFNTADFLQFEGQYTRYNFLGGGRYVRLNAAVGNLLAPQLHDAGISRFDAMSARALDEEDVKPYLRPNWQASVDFTQPWFLDPRNSLGASMFAHRKSVPGLFVDQGYGASATFTRRVVPAAPVSVNYRLERAEVQAADVYFCVSFSVCDPEQVRALQNPYRIAPLSIGGFINRTGETNTPVSGWRAQLDLEHASSFTYSEFRYNRFYAEGAYYLPVGRRSVIGFGVRGGYVQPLESTAEALGILDTAGTIIHPRKRFYAGGSRSVRGFAENQFGPRILTIPPERLPEGVIDACLAPAGDQGAETRCLAGLRDVPSSAFVPHPLGGTSLLIASVEYRFPITRSLEGAVFVDGGFVGVGNMMEIAEGSAALTPGVGARYQSPIGPIRLDVGIRPILVERLPVVTSAPGLQEELVQLGARKRFDPLEGSGTLGQIFRRLTLHLAIGQAF